MANLTALIFVMLAIVMGIGVCWVITANGAATATSSDTFGSAPPAQAVTQDAQSSDIAIKTMPILYIGFFILVCVILVAAFAWLWKTGKTKPSRY